jgi:Domain of unknown function (DUF222)/HNH endonuclease
MFDVLDDLEDAVGKLLASEPNGDDLERVSNLVERMECARLRTVGAFDRSGVWAAERFVSTASAMRSKLRCSQGYALRSIRLARKLENLTETAAAFSTGEITAEHVVEIARPYTPARAEMLEGIEKELVNYARDSAPAELRNVVKGMCDHAAIPRIPCRQHRPRSWAGARECVTDVLQIAGSSPELAAIVRAETAHGGLLSQNTLERISCDCKISRIITDGPSSVLDVGRMTRAIPAPLWNALVARDRHCTHKGCKRPPSMCEGHHIWHWANGGPTNLENLKLLCWFHHKEQHIHDARARAG